MGGPADQAGPSPSATDRVAAGGEAWPARSEFFIDGLNGVLA